jgi:iron complex outermembrane receptor protein
MNKIKLLSTSLLTCSVAIGGATAALAQGAPAAGKPDQGVADIIVTAQKRAESLHNVPVAISAFDSKALEASHVVQIFELQRLEPSLHVDLGFRSNAARITIRGIGSSGGTAVEPSVGSFLDGVYIAREGMAKTAYFDLESIEVLRGPQGTLFGRNASVGALSLHSAAPKDYFDGQLSAEYGTGERYKVDGFVNVPVSSDLSLRFAGNGEVFGGLYTNRLDGRRIGGVNTFAGRVSAKWTVASNLTDTIRMDYASRPGNNVNTQYTIMPNSFPAGTEAAFAARYAAVGGTVDPDPYSRTENGYGHNSLHDVQWGVSNNLTWDAGSGFTVNSITSYRKWDFNQNTRDVFLVPMPLIFQDNAQSSSSFSQEFQLISPTDLMNGHLSFVGGLYYYHEILNIYESYEFAQGGCDLFLPGNVRYASCVASIGSKMADNTFYQTTDSIAAYGQATVHVVPTVDLTLGARWSQDTKDATINQVAYSFAGTLFDANEVSRLHVKNSEPTYRANLSWKPNQSAMLFATYSTGYKSGGVNSTSSNVVLGQNRILAPETVKSYEIGMKTNWFDRRLLVDVVAYQMDLNNFQDRSYNGFGFSVVNAGSIRNKGVEMSAVVRPVPFLHLNAAVAYLDSKFTSYTKGSNLPGLPGTQDLTGTTPTFSPEWTGSLGGEIEGTVGHAGLSWQLHSDLLFTSSSNINGTNDNDPKTIQAGYAILGGRVTLYGPDKKWSAAIFGQNLTDKGYCTSFAYQPLGSFLGVVANGQSLLRCNTVAPPRTIGAAFSVKF